MRKSNLLIWALSTAVLFAVQAEGQTGSDALDTVTRSSSFKFVERDATCVYGKISRADATSITVQPFKKPPITIQKDGLLQISQGNALLYSARSSWADVTAATLYPHEALALRLKSGKQVKGKPIKTSADSITLKHGLSTDLYPKSEIVTVDYLRVKPATDGFMSVLGEAPWMLIFDPEFYYRATGLAGRVQVQLYDATKPEDDTLVTCTTLT